MGAAPRQESLLVFKERRQGSALESRFQDLLESCPDAMLVAAGDGRIVLANGQAEKLFGFPRAELAGQRIEMLVPERFRARHAAHRGKYTRDMSVRPMGPGMDLFGLRRDGTEFPVEISLCPLRTDEGSFVCSVIRDVTEHKRKEEELRSSREQLRLLSQRLQTVREEEDCRIAGELHDELGQQLTALKLEITRLEPRVPPGSSEVQQALAAMATRLDDAIETVRRVCGSLRPVVLEQLGLVAALRWQAREFEERTGIRCRVAAADDALSPDPVRDRALYRVLQEALTNVARHAGAKDVLLRFRRVNAHLVLEVVDDGRGITREAAAGVGSLGLLGMKERVVALGGDVEIGSTPGRGTSLHVRVPLREAGVP